MGKKKRIKKTKSGKGTHVHTPNETSFSSNNHMHPAFCFRYIQSDYCLEKYDKELQAACAKRLQHLGQTTWGEIQKADRHGMGHEIINQDSLNVSPPPNTPGDRNFLVFRLGFGKQSVMIGYRKEKIFYIVWIDPKGKVYNHS